MLFWKRREAYMGTDALEYAAIKKKLAAAGIPYDLKTDSRYRGDKGDARMLMGTMNVRMEDMYIYYIYVDKKDYQTAIEVIQTSE